MKVDANEYYYVHDHLYSPVVLANSSGTVIERYEYDAYGKPAIWNAGFTTERNSSNYGNPYLFTGRRVDILDSGSLKLQYNRNRYYDYYSGRWLTHDPEAYIDGMNLYEYARSGPIGSVDPYGNLHWLLSALIGEIVQDVLQLGLLRTVHFWIETTPAITSFKRYGPNSQKECTPPTKLRLKKRGFVAKYHKIRLDGLDNMGNDKVYETPVMYMEKYNYEVWKCVCDHWWNWRSRKTYNTDEKTVPWINVTFLKYPGGHPFYDGVKHKIETKTWFNYQSDNWDSGCKPVRPRGIRITPPHYPVPAF